MDLKSFRENQELSGGLAELLRTNDILKTAMAVADSAAPVNNGGSVADKEHVAHFQHGFDRGYNLYPTVLRLLATAPPATEDVQPTYETPEAEQE